MVAVSSLYSGLYNRRRKRKDGGGVRRLVVRWCWVLAVVERDEGGCGVGIWRATQVGN